MTAATSMPIGQRAEQVSHEAHIQTRSLSSSSLPAPRCSCRMISEGRDLVSLATGQPLEHFLHWKQTLRSTPDNSSTASFKARPVFVFLDGYHGDDLPLFHGQFRFGNLFAP